MARGSKLVSVSVTPDDYGDDDDDKAKPDQRGW